jgi:hypothetical protein
MTRISDCTDGLSNTLAIAEDAGRDPTFASPYVEVDPQVPGTGTAPRRFWRWGEADSAFGVSGVVNNSTVRVSTESQLFSSYQAAHDVGGRSEWPHANGRSATLRSGAAPA